MIGHLLFPQNKSRFRIQSSAICSLLVILFLPTITPAKVPIIDKPQPIPKSFQRIPDQNPGSPTADVIPMILQMTGTCHQLPGYFLQIRKHAKPVIKPYIINTVIFTAVLLKDLNSPRILAASISTTYEMVVAPNANAHEGMSEINDLNPLISIFHFSCSWCFHIALKCTRLICN